ncbi:hypothetical protein C8R45DRAFT_935374 [Mycena sanguinolenta]|nr:hypothetical protein C8R45DRAFT_935374 [Mycena sanguinolenta]
MEWSAGGRPWAGDTQSTRDFENKRDYLRSRMGGEVGKTTEGRVDNAYASRIRRGQRHANESQDRHLDQHLASEEEQDSGRGVGGTEGGVGWDCAGGETDTQEYRQTKVKGTLSASMRRSTRSGAMAGPRASHNHNRNRHRGISTELQYFSIQTQRARGRDGGILIFTDARIRRRARMRVEVGTRTDGPAQAPRDDNTRDYENKWDARRREERERRNSRCRWREGRCRGRADEIGGTKRKRERRSYARWTTHPETRIKQGRNPERPSGVEGRTRRQGGGTRQREGVSHGGKEVSTRAGKVKVGGGLIREWREGGLEDGRKEWAAKAVDPANWENGALEVVKIQGCKREPLNEWRPRLEPACKRSGALARTRREGGEQKRRHTDQARSSCTTPLLSVIAALSFIGVGGVQTRRAWFTRGQAVPELESRGQHWANGVDEVVVAKQCWLVTFVTDGSALISILRISLLTTLKPNLRFEFISYDDPHASNVTRTSSNAQHPWNYVSHHGQHGQEPELSPNHCRTLTVCQVDADCWYILPNTSRATHITALAIPNHHTNAIHPPSRHCHLHCGGLEGASLLIITIISHFPTPTLLVDGGTRRAGAVNGSGTGMAVENGRHLALHFRDSKFKRAKRKTEKTHKHINGTELSDVQGPAWSESPGSGFEFLKPKPKPSERAWPGRVWA